MFKNWLTKAVVSALGISFVGMASCINQDDFEFDKIAGVKLNPSYAVPVVSGSLSIKDLLAKRESDLVKEDEDGLIYLEYNNELKSQSIRDLFIFDTVRLEKFYTAPSTTILSGSSKVIVDKTEEMDFGFPDARIDKIYFKQGLIKINTSSSVDGKVNLEVTFPTILKNNLPLTASFILENNSGQSKTIDIQDYMADLTMHPVAGNKFPVKVKATVIAENQQVITAPTHTIALKIGMTNLDYRLIEGYFGQQSVEMPTDEIMLDFFSNTLNNKVDFRLREPKIELVVKNDNGVAIRTHIDVLEARKEGSALALQTGAGTYVDVNHPTTVGGEAITRVPVLNTNELIDFKPTSLAYALRGTLNPGVTDAYNFVTDTSEAVVSLHTMVPLYGRMSGLTLTDTLDFSLQFDQATVEQATMKINIRNDFPLDAIVQISFLDSKNNVKDVLFLDNQRNIIVASTVDNNGELVQAGRYQEEIAISNERFKNLLESKKLIIEAQLSTSKAADGTQPDVKIKSSYKLDVDLGVKVQVKGTIKI